MTQVEIKVFPALLALLLILGAASCSSRCVLIRSEYYDVTGKALTPKPESQDIPILTQAPGRPYVRIGVIKVEAPWGTSDAAIDAEMKGRARLAGADALVGVTHEENKNEQVVFCGKVFNTRKSIVARGAAIVYTDKGPDA
jgi:hypothetical protein